MSGSGRRHLERLIRAAARGAILGALLFSADLAGLALARHTLFDPRLGTFGLIALAALTTVGAVTLAAILVAFAWPSRWRVGPRRFRALAATLVSLTLVVAYVGRIDRALDDPGPRPPVSAERPIPVLWIVIDTLRADTLYGADDGLPLAPHLAALASRGLVFTDAESTAGWTLPSMATVLTGLSPSALLSRGYLPTWAPTVAERLRSAGYETHAIVDNGLIEPRTGYLRGFETFVQRSSMRFAHALPGFRLMGSYARRKVREQVSSYLGAEGVTDAALDQLGRIGDAPPFLYVHYMDPHYPYYAHPELGPEPAGLEAVSLPQATLRRQGGTLRPAQLGFLRERYAGEITYLDGHLGRLLEAWRARYGDAGFVLVTADHGEEFLEHGWLGHVRNVHRELVHVPLIVSLPPTLDIAQGGRRIPESVSLVDLVPTLLDAVGVAAAAGAIAPQGGSWMAWLRGESPAPNRPLVAWQDYMGVELTRYRAGDLVLLERKEHGKTSLFLYDRATDPSEQHDVGPTRPSVRDTLTTRMRARFAEDARLATLPNDAEMNEEALRALGYLQ